MPSTIDNQYNPATGTLLASVNLDLIHKAHIVETNIRLLTHNGEPMEGVHSNPIDSTDSTDKETSLKLINLTIYLGQSNTIEHYASKIPALIRNAKRVQSQLWSLLTIRERCKFLMKAFYYIANNAHRIATLISAANGKTKVDALSTEVFPVLTSLQWYINNAEMLVGDINSTTNRTNSSSYNKKREVISNNNMIFNTGGKPSMLFKNKVNYLCHESVGVVGVITPWNYPFCIPFVDCIMALITGNSVILKVAGPTLLVGLIIEEIFNNCCDCELCESQRQSYYDQYWNKNKLNCVSSQLSTNRDGVKGFARPQDMSVMLHNLRMIVDDYGSNDECSFANIVGMFKGLWESIVGKQSTFNSIQSCVCDRKICYKLPKYLFNFIVVNGVLAGPSLLGCHRTVNELAKNEKDKVSDEDFKDVDYIFKSYVDKLFFTGSEGVGKTLLAQSAEHLVPLSLELGGKDAMIVLPPGNCINVPTSSVAYKNTMQDEITSTGGVIDLKITTDDIVNKEGNYAFNNIHNYVARAVNGALWAGLSNAGQSCGGVERIYVVDNGAPCASGISLYDEFTTLLCAKTKLLRHGSDNSFSSPEKLAPSFSKDDENPIPDIGSITTMRQLRVIKKHVRQAVKAGAVIAAISLPVGAAKAHEEKLKEKRKARLIKKGKGDLVLSAKTPEALMQLFEYNLNDESDDEEEFEAPFFYPAVILLNCTPAMAVIKDETFGPVLPIMRTSSVAEAVFYANQNSLGLTGSVWHEADFDYHALSSECSANPLTNFLRNRCHAEHDGVRDRYRAMAGYYLDSRVMAGDQNEAFMIRNKNTTRVIAPTKAEGSGDKYDGKFSDTEDKSVDTESDKDKSKSGFTFKDRQKLMINNYARIFGENLPGDGSISSNTKPVAKYVNPYLLARYLDAGVISINDHLCSHAYSECPWGGFKSSGNSCNASKTHGILGLSECTRIKCVSYDVASAAANSACNPNAFRGAPQKKLGMKECILTKINKALSLPRDVMYYDARNGNVQDPKAPTSREGINPKNLVNTGDDLYVALIRVIEFLIPGSQTLEFTGNKKMFLQKNPKTGERVIVAGRVTTSWCKNFINCFKATFWVFLWSLQNLKEMGAVLSTKMTTDYNVEVDRETMETVKKFQQKQKQEH